MIALGIDSGTQSTKTLALDLETGQTLATASQSYDLIPNLPPGHLEQDPATWLEALDGTVREVLGKLGPRKEEVLAIGVSGQQHGFVPLDKKNKVIRPAKLWCDTSTVEQCQQFRAEFGGAEGLIELAGNDILPGYTAPKILWLKQEEPRNFKALETVLCRTIISICTSPATARWSSATPPGPGLMDVRETKWCEPLVEFIDPELRRGASAARLLPPRRWPAARKPARGMGTLKEERRGERRRRRQHDGRDRHRQCAAGSGDGVAWALPGPFTPTRRSRSSILKGKSPAFCDSTDRWLPLVCTMNVTVATEQVRRCSGGSTSNWRARSLERRPARTDCCSCLT